MNRRAFLGAAALGGVGAVAGYRAGRAGEARAVEEARFHPDDLLGQGEAARRWYRLKVIGQPVMDTQLLFWLGLAPNRLTDIGEVLDTGTRIAAGDEVSWFEAWLGTADRVRRYGDQAKAAGHDRSAGAHYLRAGAYYRAGLMRYARREDPRIVAATRDALRLHDQALSLLGYDSHEIAIPYGASQLFGRVHYAPGVERAPAIVLHQGLHAWPEDTMWVVDEALHRGYHVLSFHGPGQGASLRLYQHTFRPDWEVPVAAVLDVAEGLPRIDPSRMVLMGLSFGGFLAPRAAAHEPRLYGLIADPGVVDWGASMLRHFEAIPGIMALHRNGPDAFDRAIAAASAVMPDAAWYFEDVTWKHGVGSPHEVVSELGRYENRDGIGKIRCKTLILEGVAEDATPGESRRMFDALTCPKTLVEFDGASAAQTHCQGGGTVLASARLFDWLDDAVGA